MEYPEPEDFFNGEIKDGIDLVTIKGKKGPKDRIIVCCCQECGARRWVLLEDWLLWARMKGNIEDINYPPPKKGRRMLIEALEMAFVRPNGRWIYTIEEVLKRFSTPGYR